MLSLLARSYDYGAREPQNHIGVLPGEVIVELLMNAIPAKVAGVERLCIAVPTPDGVANPLVLLAARIAGVDEIYRIGGAQAIAALAYGTESIAPVDKITGPGNAFVAAAKRRVFGKVGIDMIAGIRIIGDWTNSSVDIVTAPGRTSGSPEACASAPASRSPAAWTSSSASGSSAG